VRCPGSLVERNGRQVVAGCVHATGATTTARRREPSRSGRASAPRRRSAPAGRHPSVRRPRSTGTCGPWEHPLPEPAVSWRGEHHHGPLPGIVRPRCPL